MIRRTLIALFTLAALAVATQADIYRPYPPCTRTDCW